MSREVLGSEWSRDPGREPGAPVELVDVETVRPGAPDGAPQERGPEPRPSNRLWRWLRGGRVPASALVLALVVGAAVGWAGPRWQQQRRQVARLDLQLDLAGVTGGGGGTAELDTALTNRGPRAVTVTGGHAGPAQLRVLRPSPPEPVAPGAKQALVLLAVLGPEGGCDQLRGADGKALSLPVVLKVTDAGGRSREVTLPGEDPGLQLAETFCPQPVMTPDPVQVDVSVAADGTAAVHLVLLLAAAEPVVVTRIDGITSSDPTLPVRMDPNARLALDLVLPAPQCPSLGGGFPPSGLSVTTQTVGQQSEQGFWVDLGADYVTAMVKYLARCPAG